MLCQVNPIITFQIVCENEDKTKPEIQRGMMTSDYDGRHDIIEAFPKCVAQTYLVVHEERCGYFGNEYVILMFGRCIDHRCFRKAADHLGVFYSRKTHKWRWLKLCEGSYPDKDFAKKMHQTFHQKYHVPKALQ
jgi:hypothetical protein